MLYFVIMYLTYRRSRDCGSVVLLLR